MDYEDKTNEERQAPAVQSTEQSVLQDQEDEDKSNMKLPDEDMFYNYEELYSRPFITPQSEIPENLLHLSHSFGYDCERRANLQLLDERTLAFIAGNLVVLLDVSTKEQHYLRSCSGGGIGTIMAHPSKRYFAVAEKGDQPNIIVYAYPSLRPYRILRGGTERAYSCVDFNHDGTLLASVGCVPDCMLTLWDWRQEQVMLRCKAFSRDVYRVTFSPDRPGQLTTSAAGHIKFWKMTSTFTGLKLQGLTGRFGKTAPTDIKGYIELPDGKVVSGSEWGNMLLWEGGLLKVEICRKGGRTCHTGAIQQFTLDEGELMTIGSDGVIRSWDFESIDAADRNNDSEMFELEPMNELVVGRNVSLSSMVRSSQPDSWFIWFAQDSNGCIWKLDLSFSNITQDPECLFSFHAGGIQGMDVSRISHLMATTSLDCSVKVYDFLAKRELTTSQFKQGGTALSWAPPVVNQRGGLLVAGFEDGVVRLLELYNPQSLQSVAALAGRSGKCGEAELHLKQAFKPHTAPVTAIAYERNGEILATGSSDCTVFFFTAREQYSPIGFVEVPGPVKQLEWSPQSHSQNTLLILCASGHVVEVQSPDPEDQSRPSKTYQLSELPARSFTFRSIKSRIKREAAVARRQEIKLRKAGERAGRLKRARESGQEADDEEQEEQNEEEEEEADETPPIYIPDPPSPLCCGFYSEPGQFWLSMGGYDAGFLYHCKFSETQHADPSQLQDEPFAFLPVQNTDEDPIHTISFSSDRQLMLCGMHSGTIRVYPLQPGDHLLLASMQAYWSLGVHDNQYGHLRHVRCSHDDQFVLTAGADGNIFSFSLLPPEELQRALRRRKAKVPSPRPGVEAEGTAPDIEDPAAYSIATAKQKLEMDRMRREAEERKVERRKTLVDLQNRFKQLLHQNHGLPEHVRLQSMELELDCRFREEAERLKVERVKEVRKELNWEEDRHRIALHKIQQFWDSLQGSDTVTVVAVRSDHRVSTYRLPALSQSAKQLEQRSHTGSVELGHEMPPSEGQGSQVIEELDDLTGGAVLSPVAPPGGLKLASRQAEKLRKAAEKAERAKAKIEKRKKDWDEFYAAKPDENSEDPKDVLAIQHATENMGDLKLKTAKDFTVPEQLRMNAEKKKAELVALEEKIHEKKTAMNARIVALRDAKVILISRLRSRARQLRRIQQRLAPHLHRPLPPLPRMVAEEMPERRLRPSHATLERYGALLLAQSSSHTESQDEGGWSLLEQLEKEREGDEEEEEEEDDCSGTSLSRDVEVEAGGGVELTEVEAGGGVELTEVEEEVSMEDDITLTYEQDSVLEQMETWAWRFDAELRLLRHHKLLLDGRLKLADLQHVRLYQELVLLRRLEDSENSLQEVLNARMKKEESDIRSKLEECNRQLDLKRRNVAKLQEREKAMMAAFQAMLGETKCADLLTKVFRKKIKRVKEKEKARDEEEEDAGDDDSDEEEGEWGGDADYSGSESSGAQLDDNVCPPDCDPQLFEKTVRLREHRLDLEELQAEEKRSAEALKKECDSLLKKEKVVQSNLKAAEGELELFNREKQQKLNEVDVVVPLRLHQIVSDGMVPSDLSSALVLNRATLSRLQERIKELHVENSKQGDLYRGARKQHVQLIHDRRDMESRIHELEERCQQMMMMKFGKLVDLEALQTLSGSRTLEEMRQDSQLRQAAHDTQTKQWEVKVMQAREALMEVTRCNTERLLRMNSLLHHKHQLEDTLNTRQKNMVGQLEDQHRWVEEEEAHRLQQLLKAQAQQAEALRREMLILSRKGGHILPPSHAPLPPSSSTPTSHRPGGPRLYRLGHAHPAASSQGAD